MPLQTDDKVPQMVVDEMAAYMETAHLSSVAFHRSPDGTVKIEKLAHEKRRPQ